MNKIKVAILGATWHIARWIIDRFWVHSEYQLFLFSRKTKDVEMFLEKQNITWTCSNYIDFHIYSYDVIINCIWIGAPRNLRYSFYEQMKITEDYDWLILEYLFKWPDTLYINLSSWAVYNSSFQNFSNKNPSLDIHVNNLKRSDCYGISKLNSECKHRILEEFSIIDIRIFSYISRYIDLKSWFLLSDIVNAVNTDSLLFISNDEIFRDYVSHFELFDCIEWLIKSSKKMNFSIDISSTKPISKTELLLFCKDRFWLRFEYVEEEISTTGIKKYYYPKNYYIWYIPIRSSLEIIQSELSILLDKKNPT